MMLLRRTDREYAVIHLQGLPTTVTAVEWGLTELGPWQPLPKVGTEYAVLFRGPDFQGDDQGTLVTDPVQVWVHIVDTPEEWVVNAGGVRLR